MNLLGNLECLLPSALKHLKHLVLQRCQLPWLGRWARLHDLDGFLRLGWLPLPTLAGTYHGHFAVHVVWLCACPVVTPLR